MIMSFNNESRLIYIVTFLYVCMACIFIYSIILLLIYLLLHGYYNTCTQQYFTRALLKWLLVFFLYGRKITMCQT